MHQITITQITPEELEVLLEKVLRKILNIKDLEAKHKPDFITRKEASQFLGISLVTLDKWSDKGIIKAYRIGSRIRYNKNEIPDSLIRLDSIRFRRNKLD